MKINLTFKDPDGVYESVEEAAKDSVASLEGIDDDEREELIETRRQKYMDAIGDWIEYGEYCRVEIDTEASTATVKKVKS